MKGNLILVKNYRFFSNLIRKITKSEYNHIGLFVSDDTIVEALFGGVHTNSYSQFKKAKAKKKLDYAIYTIKDISDKQIEKMTNFALDKVGTKYDFIQFICIAFMFFFKITRRIEPIEEGRKWICSELMAESAYEAGIRFQDNVDPDNTTPGDIASSSIVERII